MNPLLHALNTGTLAAWLSVAVAGVAGLLLPDRDPRSPARSAEVTTIEWKEPEITLNPDDEPAPEMIEPAPAMETEDPVPKPPEMPEIAEMEPLPEIPDLPPPPQPVAKPIESIRKSAAPAPRHVDPPRRTVSSPPANNQTRATQAAAPASGAAAQTSRLAAGRMPAPAYPSESRRKGQTGTVVVEFTIDTSGRVISAVAKSPSPWPLLNEEAVRTVRRWRFPPGAVMKIQRPIVFQLR